MKQINLITVDTPPQPSGIDLRLGSVVDVMNNLNRPPTLIVSDPPWSYTNGIGVASPDLQYQTVTDTMIAEWLAQAYEVAAPNSRLVVWCTWSKLAQWWDAVEACETWKWGFKTGGSWHKVTGIGVGYHWRGDSELVLVYTKGSPFIGSSWLGNAHQGPRRRHSEKPFEWLMKWIPKWTEEGDLILDLFSGLGPMARATARVGGRDYVGAEIDPDRWRESVDALALDKRNR